MRYRNLGATGMDVSAYCLGTMMFGSVGNGDHADCVRIIHAALDAGVNFVDTADMYSAGESEEIVGKALQGRRGDVVLASKVHFQMGDGRNRSGNGRRWILTALEDSLRRLQTDWIDLYQVHRPDRSTDIEETLSVLTDLMQQGKIRAFGCSTFPAEDIVEAHVVAERRGLHPFRTEQPPYSILVRGIERSVLPVCERHHMGVLTWGPLGLGFLTGKHRKGHSEVGTSKRPGIMPHQFDTSDPRIQAKYDAAETLAELAAEVGCTLPQLAVAFTLAHPGVTSTILGPRTAEQLDNLLAGVELELDDAVLDRIDDIVPPGTDLNAPPWDPPAITEASRRRRVNGTRVAA